jgi:hypothetical protein
MGELILAKPHPPIDVTGASAGRRDSIVGGGRPVLLLLLVQGLVERQPPPPLVEEQPLVTVWVPPPPLVRESVQQQQQLQGLLLLLQPQIAKGSGIRHFFDRHHDGSSDWSIVQSRLDQNLGQDSIILGFKKSMLVLSISILAVASPATNSWPSTKYHSAKIPVSMVGDKAGIPTTM